MSDFDFQVGDLIELYEGGPFKIAAIGEVSFLGSPVWPAATRKEYSLPKDCPWKLYVPPCPFAAGDWVDRADVGFVGPQRVKSVQRGPGNRWVIYTVENSGGWCHDDNPNSRFRLVKVDPPAPFQPGDWVDRPSGHGGFKGPQKVTAVRWELSFWVVGTEQAGFLWLHQDDPNSPYRMVKVEPPATRKEYTVVTEERTPGPGDNYFSKAKGGPYLDKIVLFDDVPARLRADSDGALRVHGTSVREVIVEVRPK